MNAHEVGRLTVGDPAPDVTIFDLLGQPVALSDLWRQGPLIVEFLRHFG